MALIEQQAAIDAIHCDIVITGRQNAETVCKAIEQFTENIKAIPPAEPVEAIPVEWIEAEIKYLKAANFEFTARAANHIEAMLRKWRGEQEAEHDRS